MGESEHCNLALVISVASVGMSLINGQSEELAYFSLSDSTASWHLQSSKKGPWEQMSVPMSSFLEEKYQQKDAKTVDLPGVLEVFMC